MANKKKNSGGSIVSRLIGIVAIAVGFTRVIILFEDMGVIESFSSFAFYMYLGTAILGILAYIGGSR